MTVYLFRKFFCSAAELRTQSKLRQSAATVAHGTIWQFERSIVAMEQINDAGFCGRNSCSFNAVDACGRLVGLASNGN
jgi:hypothetical protein